MATARVRVSKAEKRQIRKKKVSTVKPAEKPFSIPSIEARNPIQQKYLQGLENKSQTFSLGPAGCGKTYIATHWAIQKLYEKTFTKFIITRPMVSSDKTENIGFLPGDLNMKFTPWALPIIDVVEKLIGKPKTTEFLKTGAIEFAPFQFMRGRTFDDNCLVLLDEAQNCNYEQLRLFVTRLGECKTIISGDPTPGQCDIRNSGLTRIVNMVQRYKIDAAICNFTSEEVVRSALCKSWVKAFEAEEIVVRDIRDAA